MPRKQATSRARVVALSSLTPAQRRAVAALIRAQEAADAARQAAERAA